MTNQIKHFLLVFDYSTNELTEREFGGDVASALKAYRETEVKLKGRTDVDIVLVGSDSLETVKITHANYFDGSVAKSQFLIGI
jgi:hypothetical protein